MSRYTIVLGCCLVATVGCRLPGGCHADRRDCSPAVPPPPRPSAPLACQAEQSNVCRPAKVPPLTELPPEIPDFARACPIPPQTIPPQRVIIEVIQQDHNHSDHKSIASLAPAPSAPLPAAIAPPSAAPPFAAMPAGVPAGMPGVIATGQPAHFGIVLDVGMITDWLVQPFRWIRPIVLPLPPAPMLSQSLLVGAPAAMPGAALLPVQAIATAGPAIAPAMAVSAPPALNQAGLRASDVDDLARQVRELRDALKQKGTAP